MKDRPCECLNFTPRGKYNNYEPLLVPISEIIKDVRVTRLMQFPLPKKRKFPPVDKSKYFKFHKDYGHDTNGYVLLKDEIKSLIRKSKLGKYRRYEE